MHRVGDNGRMDPISDELTGRMPVVAHEDTGAECCGCIVAAVDGTDVELRFNECGVVVSIVHLEIRKGMLGLA